MVTLKDGTTFETPKMDNLYEYKFATLYKPHPKGKFATPTEGESMTQQQFKAECDVNNILAKYKKTGQINHLAKHNGNFGDFSNIEDYQTALDKIAQAELAFNDLSSDIRSKFHNDPGKLIDFLSDEKNNKEAIELGLKIERRQEVNLSKEFEKALDNHEQKKTRITKKND